MHDELFGKYQKYFEAFSWGFPLLFAGYFAYHVVRAIFV